MNITVLRTYRAQLEETLRAEVAELQLALQATLDKRRRLEEATVKQVKMYLAKSRHGMTAHEVAKWHQMLDHFAKILRDSAEAALQVQRRLEQKQAEALEASQETKKLEILERREALQRHRKEEKQAQRQADEVAARRWQTAGPR